MSNSCESIQDELVGLLYEGEETSPSVKEHLRQCNQCSATLQSYQKVQGLYRSLPELSPSPRLTETVFERVSTPPKSAFFIQWFRWIFLHPASVAVVVFVLTLGGTLYVRKYFPWFPRDNSKQTAIALKSEAPSAEGMVASPSASLSPMVRSNVRMVDWNPMPHLEADLDRPVLKQTDLPSLEQATVESICAFKQHIALRHIMDGDYAKADQILDGIIDNYLNYSNWEQAVVMHMNLMKKLGAPRKSNVASPRLRECAMPSPVLSGIDSDIQWSSPKTVSILQKLIPILITFPPREHFYFL
jgi:hypothetical protein